MGIQPLSRPWPMSQPINLTNVRPHLHHQNQTSASPSYKLLYNPPQTYSSISTGNNNGSGSNGNTNNNNSNGTLLSGSTIYEQHERFALEQQDQRQRQSKQQQMMSHDYETIGQCNEDMDHYEKYKTLMRSRPKSMIMLEQESESNYKSLPQTNNHHHNNSLNCSNSNNNSSSSNNNAHNNSSQSLGVVINGMDNLNLSSCSSAASETLCRNDPSLRLHSTTTPACVPWLKRIKVIKRIKRGIGLGSSPSGTQFNNLPALTFHAVHGDNIKLFNDGSVAKRVNGFCYSATFSNRPIKIKEKVCLRIVQRDETWSGAFRFGVTNRDPATLKNSLPRYVIPDLTSRPGFWVFALKEKLMNTETVINFHVNKTGEIIYSVDGVNKGVLISCVDVRKPLWAVMDLYGKTTTVQLLDNRSQLNNSRPSSAASSPASLSSHRLTSPLQSSPAASPLPACSSSLHPGNTSAYIPLSSLQTSHSYSQSYSHPLSPSHLRTSSTYSQLPPARKSEQLTHFKSTPALHPKNQPAPKPIQSSAVYQSQIYQSLGQFHNISNSNKLLSLSSAGVACGGSQSQRYNPNQNSHTNPNPNTNQYQKPNPMMNRPQLELPVYKTPPPPKRVDDYEYIYSIKCAGNSGPSSSFIPSYSSSQHAGPSTSTSNSNAPSCSNSNSNSNSNYVSIPSLSMMNKNKIMFNEGKSSMYYSSSPSESKLKAFESKSCSSPPQTSKFNQGNDKVSASLSSPSSTNSSPPRSATEIQLECLACCERAVDSVFYSCGHMCMCLQCAMETWRSKMGCPICRADVADVIRTYT